MEYSISPEGEKFKIPDEQDYKKEYLRLEKLAKAHRKEGQEIVVVMGLGFVGAVMAGVVADSTDKKTGKPVATGIVSNLKGETPPFGTGMDDDGFGHDNPVAALFIAGVARRPEDVAASVRDATGAAAKASVAARRSA